MASSTGFSWFRFTCRDFLPILGPEIPKHQVRALRSRKIGVSRAVLTDPVSGVSMIGVRLSANPDRKACFAVKKPCWDWATSWSRRAASYKAPRIALAMREGNWGPSKDWGETFHAIRSMIESAR